MMRASRMIVAAVVLLAAARAGAADNRDTAREAFREGTRLYEVAEFAKALVAFKRAYLAYEEPALLFNMAQCYRQLGEKQDALRFYKTYLHKLPNAPNREDVQRTVASLELAVAQERTARTSPPTGTIGPNERRGETRAGSDGHSEPAAAAPVAAVATPVPAAAMPGTRDTSGANGTSDTSASTTVTRTAAPQRTPLYKKWWLWTAVGVVAAGAAVGLGVGLASANGGPAQFPTVRVP